MPPRKKKAPASAPKAPQPPAKAEARWRWLKREDGSMVAERINTDWQRAQAEADLFGDTPMLSTGAHLRSISSILTELSGQLNAEVAEIAPELLAQAWQQAVGDFLSTQAELVLISQGQAIIRTSHPAVRFELQRHKKHIIQALNNTLGEGCVQTVRLQHG